MMQQLKKQSNTRDRGLLPCRIPNAANLPTVQRLEMIE